MASFHSLPKTIKPGIARLFFYSHNKIRLLLLHTHHKKIVEFPSALSFNKGNEQVEAP